MRGYAAMPLLTSLPDRFFLMIKQKGRWAVVGQMHIFGILVSGKIIQIPWGSR